MEAALLTLIIAAGEARTRATALRLILAGPGPDRALRAWAANPAHQCARPGCARCIGGSS